MNDVQLKFGLMVSVHPNLIKRSPSHFVTLKCGVQLVIGMARVRNDLTAMSRVFKQISPESIETVFERSLSYSTKHLLLPNVILYITDIEMNQNKK